MLDRELASFGISAAGISGRGMRLISFEASFETLSLNEILLQENKLSTNAGKGQASGSGKHDNELLSTTEFRTRTGRQFASAIRTTLHRVH